MHNFLPKAYFEGKFIDFKEANLSIATHALHYGTAAFGGVRGVVNKETKDRVYIFRLDKHAKRLSNSAKILNYELDQQLIKKTIIEFVKHNKSENDFYIRPLVYISSLGIAPRLHNTEKDFLIYGLELGNYLSPDGVKVCISSWQRPSDNFSPSRGKLTGNYINSSLAKTEAINRGFDEALMLNSNGYISEATGMNIFMLKDNKLITPGLEQDILEGITRESIIQIATEELGIEVVERPIAKSELIIADEVFLSGTAAKVAPVYQVENYNLSKHKPIATKLQSILGEIFEGKSKKYKDWITEIMY